MKRRKLGLILAALVAAMIAGFVDFYAPFRWLKSGVHRALTWPVGQVPGNAFQFLQEGQEAAKRGDWKTATERFENARNIAPENPTVLHCLAIGHEKQSNYLQAIVWQQAYAASLENPVQAEDIRKHVAELVAKCRRQIRKLVLFGLESGATDPQQQKIAVMTLAAAGDIERANQFLQESHDSSQLQELLLFFVHGLVYGGQHEDSLTMARRFPDINYWRCCETEISEGNHEEVGRWFPLLSKAHDAFMVAKMHASMGNADLVMQSLAKSISRREDIDLFDAGSEWSCSVLRRASPKAIRDFIMVDEIANTNKLYAMIWCMIRWGYFEEAEKTASFIADPGYRGAILVDVIEAKAAIGQITPAERRQQLVALHKNKEYAKAAHKIDCALVAAAVDRGDFAYARDLIEYMNDHKNDDALPLKRNFLDVDRPYVEAVWLLVQAYAKAGKVADARTLADTRLDHDFKDAMQVYFDIVEGRKDPDTPGIPYRPLASDPVAAAVNLRCTQGKWQGIQKALKASLSNGMPGDTCRIPWFLAIITSAYQHGDTATSQETLRELLKLLSYRDSSESYIFIDIAAELARVGDTRGIRDVVQLALCREGGKPSEELVHRLVQFQQFAGDVEGAKQTIAMSSQYSPSREIYSWILVSRKIGRNVSPLRYGFDEWFGEIRDDKDKSDEIKSVMSIAEEMTKMIYKLQSQNKRWRQWQASCGTPSNK